MIARAERAHFLTLALFGAVGDRPRVRPGDAALLLDALEILGAPKTLLERPSRAAGQHGRHLLVAERDLALRADAHRHMRIKRIGELLLHREDLVARERGEMRADATGNVESDASRRHHTALFRIERGNAADGKAIAPVSVRHRERGFDDSGKLRDVHRLLVDLAVHVADQRFAGEDHRRHTRCAGLRDFPLVFGPALE